mmetsp:Transcript_13375/g.23794  ORF Transcript_13375/g.23794 Transcript_13375/m.23794 type:complete len:97 (+) Transcript_13375:1771-2061(+)
MVLKPRKRRRLSHRCHRLLCNLSRLKMRWRPQTEVSGVALVFFFPTETNSQCNSLGVLAVATTKEEIQRRLGVRKWKKKRYWTPKGNNYAQKHEDR